MELDLEPSTYAKRLEKLDAGLRAWALEWATEEQHYPVLIQRPTLQRAGYPDAFPHLLMTPAVARDPAESLAEGNMVLTEWCLSPAVCYHTYAGLEGRMLDPGVMITARGHCFRNEDAATLAPGRRQIEFQMREVVLVGAASWIDAQLQSIQPEVERLAHRHGLEGAWGPANDPFFLPRARGQAHLQRLLGTKIEWCLPDGLAVASINRHGAFFGERFHIRDGSGATAHSACVAFGLDRWASSATTL